MNFKRLYDMLFSYFIDAMWYNSTIISIFGVVLKWGSVT